MLKHGARRYLILTASAGLILSAAACAGKSGSSTQSASTSGKAVRSAPATDGATTSTSGASTTSDGSSITLGVAPPGGHSKGYGQVEPRGTLDDGGDASQIMTNVTWSSWGGATAYGSGTGSYSPQGAPLADATPAPVSIEAQDIGECDGHRAYTKLVIAFANGDGTGSTPMDICGWS